MPTTPAAHPPTVPALSRRGFLGRAAAFTGAAGASTLAGTGVAGAAAPLAGRRVVVVFLRGGADGLSLVAPLGDPDYARRRPTIAVTPATARPLAGPAPDAFFAMHPAAARLSQLYDGGRMAVVHAAGSPDPTRSHFDAQALMESGVLDQRHGATGWGGRWLTRTSAPADHPLRGVAIGGGVPASLRGFPVVAASGISELSLFTWGPPLDVVTASTEDLYRRPGVHPLLTTWAGPTLSTLSQLAGLGDTSRPAGWPDTDAGNALWPIARLIEAGLPVEVAHADVGGWDTHDDMGAPTDPWGRMARRVADLDAAIGAFFDRLGAAGDATTMVVMTEFGRRAYENASGGTDHGRAFPVLVLGGGVRPGVRGSWPGLSDAALDSGDLRVTTDYRHVLSEVLVRRLGADSSHLSEVFPRFTSTPTNWPGVCT